MICWAAHCGRCPSRDAIRSKVPHTAPPTTRIGEAREASSSPPALSVRRPDLYSAPILPSGADAVSCCGVHVDEVLLTSFPIGFSRAKRDFVKPGRRFGAVRDTVEAQSTGFSKNTPRRASSIRSLDAAPHHPLTLLNPQRTPLSSRVRAPDLADGFGLSILRKLV